MHLLAMLTVLGTLSAEGPLANAEIVRGRFHSDAKDRDVISIACGLDAHTDIDGKKVPIAMSVGEYDCPRASGRALPIAVRLETASGKGLVIVEAYATHDDVPAVRETVTSVGLELKKRIARLPRPVPVESSTTSSSSASSASTKSRGDDHAAEIVGGLLLVGGTIAGVVGLVVAISNAKGPSWSFSGFGGYH